MTLDQWATRWQIPAAAIAEMRAYLAPSVSSSGGASERAVQQHQRLAMAERGGVYWRNNTGALKDDRGVPVRYGLANETPEMNRRTKSSDLIGILPVLITPAHVGTIVGQFAACECKAEGWKFTGTDREQAQLSYLWLVWSLGGHGEFASSR